MGTHPAQKRYPPELRERAVRMAQDLIAEQGGQRFGVVTRVARELGIGTESLRNWLHQADIDDGRRPGTSSADKERIVLSSGRTESCVAPTTFSRRRRFSSRLSSTVDRRSSRLHRRPPEQLLRWAAMGGRADLPDAADRPFHLLRRQGPAGLGPRRARRRAAPGPAGALGGQLLRVRPPQADEGGPQGWSRSRP